MIPGKIVAESVCSWLQYGEGMDVGLLLRGIRASRVKGNLYFVPGFFRSLFDGGVTCQNDQIGQRDLLSLASLGLGAVEFLLDLLQSRQDLREFSRLVYLPILLRCEADAGSVSPAPLVRTAERCRRCPS